MSHTTILTEYTILSDASLAIKVRTDDDPTTDSWHTINDANTKSHDDIDAEITAHKARVEARLDAITAAASYVATKVGS